MSKRTYNSEGLKTVLLSYLKQKQRMINAGYTQHKAEQLKAIRKIRDRLAFLPKGNTQAAINSYYLLREEIRAILPGWSSRFQKKREELEQLLTYAEQHHTCTSNSNL